MRIIAGIARSRRLVAPPGQTTRPMTDRMRESIFSSMAASIPNSVVLDLFAGTGSMGLEALSRGAAEATFVERDRKAVEALRTNVEALGLGGRVVAGDVNRFLQTVRGAFDLVFVDPPYAVTLASLLETMEKVSPLGITCWRFIHQRRRGEDAPETIAGLRLVDSRKYGGAEVWRYAKEHM